MKDITKMPSEFYITYFAKKHKKIITRRASKGKPNGALGKIFTDKNGTDRFIYWDKDAVSKTGWLGDWRHATGEGTIKAIQNIVEVA